MRTAPVPNMPAIPGMNPGLFVLGGGGDGGGSGGGDGKGKDGKQGAKGKNGGNDANGDGKNGGACGAGGPGACTNCGHNVSAGDPVDVVSGKVFTVPKQDMFLPGLFALSFQRSYSTVTREIDVGMGFGWVNTFAWSLHERRRSLELVTGDGRHLELPRPQEEGEYLLVGGLGVFRSGDFYTILPGNEFEHFFERTTEDPSVFRLRFVKFRNRGQIALQYERGVLARAVDTVGRVIHFGSNPQGRITSISVMEPGGRTLVFARYSYDERGDLITVTDADDHVTRYAYDDEHRLTRLDYPSGLVLHYVYDEAGRCTETWGERPGYTDPALAPDLPPTLADNKTRVKGIFHCRLEYAADESYTEVIDSVRLRTFTSGPSGTVAKASSGRGGITTRVYDDRDRVIAKTDAEGGTWSYEYNEIDKIVREVDPDGHEVRITYDGAGNEIEVVNQEGGVTTIARDANEEITNVRDPAGGVLTLDVTPNGLTTRATDSRGGQHVYEWDAHANCVARTFPNGARFQYQYDYWGRRVREIDGAGEAIDLAYDNSGRLIEHRNAFGHTMRFRYDGMGNLVEQTRQDGATTVREYGGLNWLCRVRHADGSELRGFYNYEGWLMVAENELGEKQLFEHDADGLITWEREFTGRERRYGHDLIGRVVWYDDGAGKIQRTLSPAGHILKEEAPDGSVREYEYSPCGGLVRAVSGTEGMEWELDAMGRVVRETLLVDGQKYSVESRREPSGDRTGFRTSMGLALGLRRDPTGRVSEIWSGSDRVLGISRNVMSQPVRRELTAGGAVVDTYDAIRMLRRREIVSAGATAPDTSRPDWVGRGAPGVVDRRYDYTPILEVEKVTSSDGDDIEYSYDVRRHLTRVRRGNDMTDLSADAAGNHYERGAAAKSRTYGPGGKLLKWGDFSYEYDDRGFLIEKRRFVTGAAEPEITRYVWNIWGMLERVEMPDGTKVIHKYDPFARRLGKRVIGRDGKVIEDRHYVWDLLSIVHEVSVDPAKGPVDARSYLFEDNGDSVPLGHREDGRWMYYIHDPNGVPEEILDGAGNVVGKLARTPFGRTTLVEGSVSTPFRHPGQIDDPETGLHYNRYRYYDPDIGRYISPDPLGLNGGFHLYEIGPNPVGWSDPMGLHTMTMTGTNDPTFPSATNHSSSPGVYNSGSSTAPCPPQLANRANCHTEQKFAWDLINHNDAQGTPGQQNLTGRTYDLQGDLPPCPTCHQALRTAAAKTGAKITYSWGAPHPGSFTYDGSAAPTATGSGGGLLKANYNNPIPNNDRTWKAQSGPGARDAYSALRAKFP